MRKGEKGGERGAKSHKHVLRKDGKFYGAVRTNETDGTVKGGKNVLA
jgi:hypothetical protein